MKYRSVRKLAVCMASVMALSSAQPALVYAENTDAEDFGSEISIQAENPEQEEVDIIYSDSDADSEDSVLSGEIPEVIEQDTTDESDEEMEIVEEEAEPEEQLGDTARVSDWETFLADLRQLEAYAEAYVDENGGDVNELVINYIRTGVEKYTDADWVTLAGAEKTAFVKYVAEKDAENNTTASGLRSLAEFTVPNGDAVEFNHLFGALNIAIFNQGNQGNIDLGSWAGDLVDLMEYSHTKGVAATEVEAMAQEIREKYLGVDDESAHTFGILDLRGDLDSFYLASKVTSTSRKLSQIMEGYFTSSLTDKDRAVYFTRNRFPGKNTQEEIRAAVLSEYQSNNGCILLESKRGISGMTDLQKAASYAFADYLYELVNGELPGVNDLYEVFSSETSTIAPGVTQTIKQATTADNQQIIYYIATADVSRSDVSIYANYNNNDGSTWAMSRVTDQMAAAKEKHSNPDSENYIENYEPVVGVNADFFNMSTGEPSGVLVMEGVIYRNDEASFDENFFAILDDGTPVIGGRKEWFAYKDRIREAVGAAATLVKNGKIAVNRSDNYYSSRASRTCIGITDDGHVVMMVLDGRQGALSVGGSAEEIAQIMLEAGCVTAVNLDGGGSTTYAAREEGASEVSVVNSPSDGYERSVSSSLMVVSTAETSTEFVRAKLSSDYDYMTVGASVQIHASGVSKSGSTAEIPENARWQITDATIASVDENGLVTGLAAGETDVQLVVDGKVVGTKKLHVVKQPTELEFTKDRLNVVYGVETPLPIQAKYNGNVVKVTDNDIVFESNPANAGTITDITFTGDEAAGVRNATITAMLKRDFTISASITLALYSNGEAIFDFENATSGDRQFAWKRSVTNTTTDDEKYYHIADPNETMDVSYIFALDMEQVPIPDKLTPLLSMVAGGDVSGITSWKLMLQLAERLNPMTNVKVTMNIDPNLAVKMEMSDIKLVNDYFTLTNAEYDETNHQLILTLNFIKQEKPIDEATANPICIVSGIKAAPSENAAWDENECLAITNSGVLKYDIYLRAGAAYAFAQQEEYQNAFGLYPFEDTVINPTYGAPDKGAHFANEYASFADSFTLDKSSYQGWKQIGNNLFYFEDNKALVGTHELPDYDGSGKKYYYGFDENGYCTGKISGLIEMNGGLYLAKNGVLQTGWQTSKDAEGNTNYYYFDPSTKKAVDGQQKIGGYHYTFKDHILVRGEIVTNSTGSRYMWAGDWVTRDFVEVDGKIYYAEMNGYFHVGFRQHFSPWFKEAKVFAFDDTGAWQREVTGLYDYHGETYYLEGGILKQGPNLIFEEGYYYYINYGADNFTNDKIFKNGNIWIDATNGYMKPGRYTFDAQGRMINPPAAPKVTVTFDANGGAGTMEVQSLEASTTTALTAAAFTKDDAVFAGWNTAADGSGTAYADGAEVKLTEDTVLYAQWKSKPYTITFKDENGTVLNTQKYDLGEMPVYTGETPEKAEDEEYRYEFRGWLPQLTEVTGDAEYTAEFTAIRKEAEETDKNGWFTDENGTAYLEKGEKKYTDQWVTIEDKTYCFDANGYVLKGVQNAAKGEETGLYVFDSETGEFLSSTNGLYKDGEDTYWTKDGQVMLNEGLVRVTADNGEINYYYFKEDGKAVKNVPVGGQDYWVSKTNDLLPEWGYYFDSEGVIIHEDTALNGIVEKDGVKYYYINGIRVHMGLFEYKGAFYYAKSNGQLVADRTYYCERMNGLKPAGPYAFDAEARMITEEPEKKNGIVAENDSLYYYADGKLTYAGLIEIDGSYYYVRTNGEVVHGRKYWISKTNGLMDEKSYAFDEDGKMIIEKTVKNGIVSENGSLFYYVNGTLTYAGLFELDGDYYYAKTSGEVIHGRSYWISKTNGLVKEASYTFDESGKMIDPPTEKPDTAKNGIVRENGSLFYYVNGVLTYAGLIEVDGSYYYVKSSGEVINGKKYWISKTNGLVSEGSYTFDENGKMV
ncbi:MAG: phosphodiester glycosidase family protein [Eubacteriales bacterium]|nr:phosphodiester glycosidase family protein [Eubacteriales bacterium]